MNLSPTALGGCVIAAIVVLWYSHHLGDSAGYERGHGEALEERNIAERERTQRIKEDNDMLASSNAYLASQIESSRKALDERDQQISALEQQARQKRGRTDAAVHKNHDWSCARVPDAIADSLRTDADANSDADSDSTAACTSRWVDKTHQLPSVSVSIQR